MDHHQVNNTNLGNFSSKFFKATQNAVSHKSISYLKSSSDNAQLGLDDHQQNKNLIFSESVLLNANIFDILAVNKDHQIEKDSAFLNSQFLTKLTEVLLDQISTIK